MFCEVPKYPVVLLKTMNLTLLCLFLCEALTEKITKFERLLNKISI